MILVQVIENQCEFKPLAWFVSGRKWHWKIGIYWKAHKIISGYFKQTNKQNLKYSNKSTFFNIAIDNKNYIIFL